MPNAIPVAPDSSSTVLGYGRVVYDSGSVASGAVITSGVLDLRPYQAVRITVLNSSGTNTRALTMQEYAEDLTTALPAAATPQAIGTVGTSAHVNYCLASTPNLTSAVSNGVPIAAVFSLAAAGTSAGRVIITGR